MFTEATREETARRHTLSVIQPNGPFVGAWNWSEAKFYMQTTARPRLFHRAMMKLFFGIRWVEGEAPWNDLG